MWKTLSEEPIEDIIAWVKLNSTGGKVVHVGTDSLQSGTKTQFVTVIAILNPGKGGRAAYIRSTIPRISSLRERLFKEVWYSVDLGLQLDSVVDGDLTIHIDANTELKHKSSQYVQALVGMVVSNGFKALVKPEAFVSTHAADHVVRLKNVLHAKARIAELGQASPGQHNK